MSGPKSSNWSDGARTSHRAESATDLRRIAVDQAAALSRFAALVTENRDELDRLDAAAGDGDHGTTVARGLASALASPCLLDAGRRFLEAAGGASGPLFGTCLSAIGRALDDGAPLSDAIQAGVDRVVALGGAAPGERTLIDALVPAVEALRRGEDPVAAARAGAEATAAMQARHGRAVHLANRGVGTVDPGARTAALLVEALCAN